jgi:hypothetical protein
MKGFQFFSLSSPSGGSGAPDRYCNRMMPRDHGSPLPPLPALPALLLLGAALAGALPGTPLAPGASCPGTWCGCAAP